LENQTVKTFRQYADLSNQIPEVGENPMFLKSFLKVFAYVLVYMAIWAAILFAGIKGIQRAPHDVRILYFGLSCMVLMMIGFIPFLDFAAKRSFYFKGEGVPATDADLKNAILATNDFDVPVMATEKNRRLILTWRYVDARWWETIARAGLTKAYHLHVKLDKKRKVATLIDIQKDVTWGLGPMGVRLSGGYFRGIALGFEIGRQWGIKENFSLGKIYDYKFQPSEIRTPVLNTILKSGWDARLGIW
jgi:hypothetical protein